MDQSLIDALLVEREGYARAGRQDRVQAVDDSLKAAGYTPRVKDRAKAGKPERAVKTAPEKRG